MDSVALMKRVDTKFALNQSQLLQVLEDLSSSYQALEINEQKAMSYKSVYFDTVDHKFYFQHHNQIAHRAKIRYRLYEESDLRFLEIKKKNTKGETVKSRIMTSNRADDLSADDQQFVDEVMSYDIDLRPALRSDFIRITLTHLGLGERATIDTKLSFDGNIYHPNLVIIELKQARLNPNSLMYQSLRRMGIRPLRVSKYCVGLSTMHPDLKSNNFKPKLLKINKITA